MDTSTLITVISTVITIISILIATYQVYQNSKDYINFSSKRRKAIEGKWAGTYSQNNKISDTHVEGEFAVDLKIRGKRVIGIIDVKTPSLSVEDRILIVEGGFRDERFLSLSYKNKQGEIMQFGYMMFELSPNGKNLKGKFLGFGPESEQVISGDTILKKLEYNDKK